MKKIFSMVLVAMLLVPAMAQASSYSLYYDKAKVFGKVISYDNNRNAAIVYGSIYINKNNQWMLIQSKKFIEVIPTTDSAKDFLKKVDSTVSCLGTLNSWVGQKDEVFKAKQIQIVHDYTIKTVPWYGFGKTIRPERIYKTDLEKVTDFISRLADLSNIVTGEIKQEDMQIIRETFQKNWELTWCVTKDLTVKNQQVEGVGGWQFYKGILGESNCYIESSSITRKDIDNFMNNVREGGGSTNKTGPALMCGYIDVERDIYDRIEKVRVSGALFESIPGFINTIENPENINLETWTLKGYDKDTVDNLEGQLLWLTGTRVQEYEDEKLEERYFRMHDYLTKKEFNQVLNICRNLIGQGGF